MKGGEFNGNSKKGSSKESSGKESSGKESRKEEITTVRRKRKKLGNTQKTILILEKTEILGIPLFFSYSLKLVGVNGQLPRRDCSSPRRR